MATPHVPTEGHDYGGSKPMATYPFLAGHLDLGIDAVRDPDGSMDESFVTTETRAEMLVFGPDGTWPADTVGPNTHLPEGPTTRAARYRRPGNEFWFSPVPSRPPPLQSDLEVKSFGTGASNS